MNIGLLAFKNIFVCCLSPFLFLNFSWGQTDSKNSPNILLFITDDQSWEHTSIAGEVAITTPGFDRIALEGIYFKNAICAAPSCSPSK